MRTSLARRRFLGSALALTTLPCTRLFAAEGGVYPDVEAVTGDGRQVLLRGADVRDFATRLRGELLLPTSAHYDEARRLWNGSIERHPALIARCSGPADVAEAVKFAAANRLLLSVRGGGHSFSGLSVAEKGLMIDLSQMNSVRVDRERRVATVEGGALLGALDHETLPLGLATTAGTVSHTGVGGLTLGGGFGRLGRRFGLACDNVRSFDVVTADGKLTVANGQRNKDLYWGMRGGGGNFGVATAFEFQLHPVDPIVLGGKLVWAWPDAPDVLRFFFEFATTAPDELNIDLVLLHLPNGQRLLSMDCCYSGPREQGDRVLAPLRQFRKPISDEVVPQPYTKLQASGDDANAHGGKNYIKAGFVQKSSLGLRDVMIATIDEATMPVVHAVVLPQGGGAYARVKTNATAFAQRAADHNVFVLTRWTDPSQGAAVAEWSRNAWKRIEPHTHGFYVNEYNDDASRVSTTYGPNYDRLVELKTKVDPDNLFRLNANIAPRKA